ncbi:MAG: DUF3536 domain-containing protein [Chloroflexi bacterium]|nr:DUF3536 domain-containing protein [Chloroflexota bacterium]
MERYICIHGHFYQPPRENPWLEAIEVQDSAYPYHDWNERILAECYAPNSAARILAEKEQIAKIVNNYSRISFNFGPTLLSWLEEKAPEVYEAILASDRESQKTYSGHGSAIAQAYNHLIMPLANRRDKYTQVLWGIRDFEHRFGRPPEGMWLPETAVDLETLDIMAELGIRFTILSPGQAARVRPIGARVWRDAKGGQLDPTMAYQVRLPSRRKISVFFYDAPIGHAVAFEGLLRSGEDFAGRLLGAFSETRPPEAPPQIVHVATDGETFGHHHRFGEMALAYALDSIETRGAARLTNYGEYLAKHPPTHEVEIIENTSWSCSHGVERWRGDCGDSTGAHPGWNQSWRAPLREAMDWLNSALAPRFESLGRELFKDPWQTRNDYIAVILDRSPEDVAGFLNQHATHDLSPAERVTALRLLEIQRHSMLMFTSCGWFFDDISGIEATQVLQYAGRALQLAGDVHGEDFQSPFLKIIERAKSNSPHYRDGHHIYDTFVGAARVDREKLGAHYAASSLFKDYPQRTKIYHYFVERQQYQRLEAGATKFVVGRATFDSEVTRETCDLIFGVLHFGDHNLSVGVREFLGAQAHEVLVKDAAEAFVKADLTEVIRIMSAHFGASIYSIKSLFRDEQRQIMNLVLDAPLAEAESAYREIYLRHAPLMRFFTELRTPIPKAFMAAAEFILNTELRRGFEADVVDADNARTLLDNVRNMCIELDTSGLSYALSRTIDRLAERLLTDSADLARLRRLESTVRLARSLTFEVNLWKAQNAYYAILLDVYPGFREKASSGDKTAQSWVELFRALGQKLSIRVS